MAHLTRPAVIAGVSAGSFPETEAGNRAYILLDFRKHEPVSNFRFKRLLFRGAPTDKF